MRFVRGDRHAGYEGAGVRQPGFGEGDHRQLLQPTQSNDDSRLRRSATQSALLPRSGGEFTAGKAQYYQCS